MPKIVAVWFRPEREQGGRPPMPASRQAHPANGHRKTAVRLRERIEQEQADALPPALRDLGPDPDEHFRDL